MSAPIRLRPNRPRRAAAGGLVTVALLSGCSGTAVAPDRAAAPEPTVAPTSTATELPSFGTSADDLPTGQVTFVTAEGEHTIDVRVAADPASRRVGLMGVEEVPPGLGMLFIMDAPVDHGFWMKDTLVPLDIAYVGADGRIVSILRMEPCVDYEVATEDCPSYPPGAVYDRTVEVAAGALSDMGVRVGDRVEVRDRA